MSVVIVCSRGMRRPLRRCVVCHRTARQTPLVLCDQVVRPDQALQRTCDAAVCARHAVHQAPDQDYCPAHAHDGGRARRHAGIRSTNAHAKKHAQLQAAYSPTYAASGQTVYVICGLGGCAQRVEVDAAVWQAEDARRRQAQAPDGRRP